PRTAESGQSEKNGDSLSHHDGGSCCECLLRRTLSLDYIGSALPRKGSPPELIFRILSRNPGDRSKVARMGTGGSSQVAALVARKQWEALSGAESIWRVAWITRA
ncbi:MAG: hypothetical protein AB7O26_09000, partial [Planctomycetaceae bacterium]